VPSVEFSLSRYSVFLTSGKIQVLNTEETNIVITSVNRLVAPRNMCRSELNTL